MKQILTIALLIVSITGIGQTTYAAQFNITVPVNLSKIPAEYDAIVIKAFLFCKKALLTGIDDDQFWDFSIGEGNLSGEDIVGLTQVIRAIDTNTGEFHNSITLNLDVAPGYYPENVDTYAYVFRLRNQAGQYVNPGIAGLPNSANSFFTGHLNYGYFNNPAVFPEGLNTCDINKSKSIKLKTRF